MTLVASLPREPVVPSRDHPQLPAGLQLGACIQQCTQSVCGTPGPGEVEEIRFLGRGKKGPPSVSSCPNKSLFQVWVIANKVQGSHGLSRGTVCRRMGVQPREPKGQGWVRGQPQVPGWLPHPPGPLLQC